MDKSTATEAQRHRIIEALRLRPQTSYDLRPRVRQLNA